MIDSKKIKEIRESLNFDQQQFAEKLGVSRQYISDLERGVKPISHKFTNKLQQLGLIYNIQSEEAIKPKYIKFPLRKNVRAAAGAGCYVYDEQETEYYEIPEMMIKNLPVNTNESDFIIVSGDSMSPALNDGDKILVDKSKTTIIDGKVYVIRASDRIMVKRVQKLPKGIRVISDNKEYEPYTLLEDFAICGQVLMSIREFV